MHLQDMDNSLYKSIIFIHSFLFACAAPEVRVFNLTITGITENSVDIGWTPVNCSQRYGLPVSVVINVTQTPSQLLVVQVTVPDSGNYTQTGLRPKMAYSFQLFVAYEEEITTNNGTSVDVVTAPPTTLVIDEVIPTPASAVISWSHSQPEFVVVYNVSWSYVGPCSGPGGPDDESRVLGGSARSFRITDLRPNSHYSLTLVARNGIGETETNIVINTTVAGSQSSRGLVPRL